MAMLLTAVLAAFKPSMRNLPSAIGWVNGPCIFASSEMACQDRSGRSLIGGALALTDTSAL